MQADAVWVRDLYDYDPLTGEFRWRNLPPRSRSRARSGSPAGTVDAKTGSLVLRMAGKLHQASRVAWLYVHGEWPKRQVHFRDASLPLPARNRLSNLHLAGTAEDLTAEKIREVLRYDPESGDFYWLVKRRGVVSGSLAGTIKQSNGKRHRSIRIGVADYSAARLAWLFHYGEWPKARLEFRDGDGSNTRISNIAESRFSHGTRQDNPLSDEERQERRVASYRRVDLRRSYGLTADEHAQMSEAQEHVCASCGGPQRAKHKGRIRQLAVDHDHRIADPRASVRALLCNACNLSMGAVADDLGRMLDVLLYRMKWAYPDELVAALPKVAELLSLCMAAPKEKVA